MVTKKAVDKQLKEINFPVSSLGWGRGEIKELPHILMEHEKMFECVVGIYEGGFALLVGTNVRILLIDKKPLNFLTVEDLRFDMINEIDYSHRFIGAQIKVSTGSKTLRFRSYDQGRLRHLINKVQHAMADSKKQQSEHQEDQNLHLEQINQQLQAYLLAQHQQQQELTDQLKKMHDSDLKVEPVRPSGQLSDYLYAQSLLKEYNQAAAMRPVIDAETVITKATEATHAHDTPPAPAQQQAPEPIQLPAATEPALSGDGELSPQMADLYAAGMQEIFGREVTAKPNKAKTASKPHGSVSLSSLPKQVSSAFDVNPLKIAYSKLPMALRNRKFGRPSFHAHSQATSPDIAHQS